MYYLKMKVGARGLDGKWRLQAASRGRRRPRKKCGEK